MAGAPPGRGVRGAVPTALTTSATTATGADWLRLFQGALPRMTEESKIQHPAAEHRGDHANKISVIDQLAYKNFDYCCFRHKNVK